MPTWKWLCVVAATLVLGLVGGGALVYALKAGNESDPLAPEEGRAFAPVLEPEAGTLAARFRPRLMFDSGERWRPQSIPSLLAERERNGRPLHEFCKRTLAEDECEPVGSIEEFDSLVAENRALGSSTYLDVGRYDGQYREPERSTSCREGGLLDCDDQPGSAIYYNVTSSNGRFYVDYWWFLRFNHFGLTNCSNEGSGVCDEHEGDWEGVTLVTTPEDEHTLDYIVYAAHKGTFRYPAAQLDPKNGQRPVVYVANGSHASYPRPCDALIVCWQPNLFAGVAHVPETNVDGRRPWARNDDECEPGGRGSCLQPLPTAEPGQSVWTAWAGLWGETCGTRCHAAHPQSPASPGLQNRFQHPWCSIQAGALACDSTALGCSDWLGPLVAVLACNPSAIARGLRTPEELPSGGLTLTVTAPNGERRKLSATTRGVVQALGGPLTPGSKVVVGDAGSSTEILIRAAKGNRLLEARFDPFEEGAAGRTLEISVDETESGDLVLHANRGDGATVLPEEPRRVTLKPG